MLTTHITIAGKDYPINFGLACLAELEQEFDCSIALLGEHLQQAGISGIARLAHIGIKHGHRVTKQPFEQTLEDTCDLLDSEGFAVIDKVTKILEQSMNMQAGVHKKTRANR